jgi:hypothetical protein
MRVFENRVLRRIFGPEREDDGENCEMRSFIICSLHKRDQIKEY